MARINDPNRRKNTLTGNEIVPLSDNDSLANTTLQTIIEKANESNVPQINVVDGANAFLRSYPVSGAIKKGQAVGLFEDSDGITKMRAVNNTTVEIQREQDDNLFGKLDNFSIHKDDLVGSVKFKPNSDQLSTVDGAYVSRSGIQFALTESESGSGFWTWQGEYFLSAGTLTQYQNAIKVTSISYDSNTNRGHISIETLKAVNYAPRYVYVSAVAGSVYTRINTTAYNSLQLLAFSFNLNSTHRDSFLENNILYFGFSYNNSSPPTAQYDIVRTKSEGGTSFNLDSNFNKEGIIDTPLNQSDIDNTLYNADAIINSGTPKILGKLSLDIVDRIHLTGVNFSSSNNRFNISMSAGIGRKHFEIRVGDEIIYSTIALNTFINFTGNNSITLNSSQAQKILADLSNVKIRFLDFVSESSLSFIHNYYPLEKTTNDLVLNNFPLIFQNVTPFINNIFRVSNDEIIVNLSSQATNTDVTTFDANGVPNGKDKYYKNKIRFEAILAYYKYESGAWVLKDTFAPSWSSSSKSTGHRVTEITSFTHNLVLKMAEDSSRILFVIQSRQNERLIKIVEFDKTTKEFSTRIEETDEAYNDYHNTSNLGQASGRLNFMLRVSGTNNSHHTVFVKENSYANSSDRSNNRNLNNDYNTLAFLTLNDSELSTGLKKTIIVKDQEQDYGLEFSISSTDSDLPTYKAKFYPEHQSVVITKILNDSQHSGITFSFIYLNDSLTGLRLGFNGATLDFDDPSYFYVIISNVRGGLAPDSGDSGWGGGSVVFNNNIAHVADFIFSDALFEEPEISKNFYFRLRISNGVIVGNSYYNLAIANVPRNSFSFAKRTYPESTLISIQGKTISRFRADPFRFEFPNLISFIDTEDREYIKVVNRQSEGLSVLQDLTISRAVGVSLDNYAAGATGQLNFLKGSSILTLAGLNFKPQVVYYLDNNTGELTTNGGRRLGLAISATEILLEG